MMDGMNKKVLALLGLGHLMVDMNTGALPALLPFLKSTFGLSYTMIGTLVLVTNLSSSLIQPVFGYLSDRSARTWLLPFGVMAATCGMATIGLAPSYTVLLFLVFISGIILKLIRPPIWRPARRKPLASRSSRSAGTSATVWGRWWWLSV
jgi:FSR family fosmidomycin resistance protein-like MFS transporter